MRRETRFRLIHLKEQLIALVPFVVIAVAIAALAWAIFHWAPTGYQSPSPTGAEDHSSASQ